MAGEEREQDFPLADQIRELTGDSPTRKELRQLVGLLLEEEKRARARGESICTVVDTKRECFVILNTPLRVPLTHKSDRLFVEGQRYFREDVPMEAVAYVVVSDRQGVRGILFPLLDQLSFSGDAPFREKFLILNPKHSTVPKKDGEGDWQVWDQPVGLGSQARTIIGLELGTQRILHLSGD